MKYNNSQEKFVVDCQVFQSSSWHRGMGKYSVSLLVALTQNEKLKGQKIYLLFNSNLEIPEEVTRKIEKEIPKAEVISLALETPKEPRTDFSVKDQMVKNKKILSKNLHEKFGNSKIKFLILALYLDEVCSVFPDDIDCSKLLIYYDSIPLIFHKRYGAFKGFFDNFYLPHTKTVFEADKIFTISKTVANDLHSILGVQRDRIISIDGANIPLENKGDIKVSIKHPFILMPSGQEIRKNNERAIRAFEKFRAKKGGDLKLVITSSFSSEAQEELGKISENLIFTGNVSEAELAHLYDKSLFVFFASEYEGLGLPVLEAVAKNKIIACSDIPVFKEISSSGFSYFDPLSIESIAKGLEDATSRVSSDKTHSDEYKLINNKYTWKRSAKVFVENSDVDKKPSKDFQKIKIAIFCPDPEGFSAIGKVVAESHAEYSRFFDIEYYFDKGPNHKYMRPNVLAHLVPCFQADSFTEEDHSKYSAVVYHIGNSEYHLNTIRTALAFPGFAIFHDTNLRGAYDSLVQEGYMSKRRYDLEEELDNSLSQSPKKPKSSFLTSIATGQKGIVTHSNYALEAISSKLLKKVPAVKVNLPTSTDIYPEINIPVTSRRLTVSFAGIIAKVKGTEFIDQIAKSKEFSNININIFGFSSVEPDQLDRLRKLPHVNIKTNPTDFEFQSLMIKTDILINVRLEYRGETSLTTLEQMRHGGVVFVRDFGWYSELPNDAVVKITNPDETRLVLKNFIADEARIAKTKASAVKYIQENHSHYKYAKGMKDLINGNI